VVPENLRYGGGAAGSVLHPVVALLLIITALLMWALPQRKVIIPFLLTAILIPEDQVLVIAGVHFPLLRILLFFGMVRIFLLKGNGDWKIFSGGMNKLDKAVIALELTLAIAGVLLFQNSQAVIFQCGELFNAFGLYFLLRCLIRDREDVIRVLRTLAVIVALLACIMTFERASGGRNPYGYLGGTRVSYFSQDLDRDGKTRATASFGTPIIAGVFGAITVPLFAGLWLSDRTQRGVAMLGICSGTVMTIMSNSSTPVMGYAAAVLGLCLWPVRGLMRVIRWGIAITLVVLQMVMKAPVYHLITRIDISGSSYHRYALIDQTVHHFWDWWLVGTTNNLSWGWDMWDTANQYVTSAITGGLFSLIFFISILVYGFKYAGRAAKSTMDKEQALFYWSLGATLLSYTVSFFGISLWDQSIVEWYMLLAFISAVAVPEAVAAMHRGQGALDPGIVPRAHGRLVHAGERAGRPLTPQLSGRFHRKLLQGRHAPERS
jgi:hypothetical protein